MSLYDGLDDKDEGTSKTDVGKKLKLTRRMFGAEERHVCIPKIYM